MGPGRLTGDKFLNIFALRSVSEYHVSRDRRFRTRDERYYRDGRKLVKIRRPQAPVGQ